MSPNGRQRRASTVNYGHTIELRCAFARHCKILFQRRENFTLQRAGKACFCREWARGSLRNRRAFTRPLKPDRLLLHVILEFDENAHIARIKRNKSKGAVHGHLQFDKMDPVGELSAESFAIARPKIFTSIDSTNQFEAASSAISMLTRLCRTDAKLFPQ